MSELEGGLRGARGNEVRKGDGVPWLCEGSWALSGAPGAAPEHLLQISDMIGFVFGEGRLPVRERHSHCGN